MHDKIVEFCLGLTEITSTGVKEVEKLLEKKLINKWDSLQVKFGSWLNKFSYLNMFLTCSIKTVNGPGILAALGYSLY